MNVITMPQLGETVTEGTIIAWSVGVGDRVAVDDTLFEVSTEKVDTEIPSETAGFVRAILVAEGATAPVGAAVAVLTATADEPFDLPESNPSNPSAPTVPVRAATSPPTVPTTTEPYGPSSAPDGGGASQGPDREPGTTSGSGWGETDGAILSPVVRRLLAEHDIDPAGVNGSGRDGRITRADVLAAVAARTARSIEAEPPATPAPATPVQATPVPAVPGRSAMGRSGTVDPSITAGPSAARRPEPVAPSPGRMLPDDPTVDAPEPVLEPGDEVVDLSRARLATAENLARSLATTAHALVVNEVDYSNVEAVRHEAGLSYLPFVARAAIDAIREFPHVNSSFRGTSLVVRRAVHLGVAVDVDREALMVPVIRDADGLRISAIADAVTDLADRARRHRLSGEALGGGTFTLTNVGAHGTLLAAPIINWPQVAILSTDGVRMAPTAVRTDPGGDVAEWGIAVHPLGNLSLSFDHRAFDGAYAAAFLARVREILQTRDWTKEVGAP